MSGMFTKSVYVLYFAYCGLLFVSQISWFDMPNDTSWFELSGVVAISLCVISVLALLSRRELRYIVLTG